MSASAQIAASARPEYQRFLAAKAPKFRPAGFAPSPLPAHLFDYQAACVDFAVRVGRCAMFLDTGLGKTRIQGEFVRQCASASNGYGLILTPLAVARQMERELSGLGYDVRVVRDSSQVQRGISICNYDRLDSLNPDVFGAVSLDESSILKAFTGRTTRKLIRAFASTPYRMCATATPAPNDHMELGQHADFLGIMPSNEMLARWFTSDQTQMGRYRLKRHGESAFWDWVSSWARCAESPADLGFDGSRHRLPEMRVIRHQTSGDVRRPVGSLFRLELSATEVHGVKRQTADARADVVRGLVEAEPDEAWVIWCDTDYEANALVARIPAAVEVRGSHTAERKEAAIEAFATGRAKYIICKPSSCQFGLNWQHAARMAFVGRSFSYESWYQAVRRCWRFGQTRPVDVHIVVAEGEDQIGRVIGRKAEDHSKMKQAMAAAMLRARSVSANLMVAYEPKHKSEVPSWLFSA